MARDIDESAASLAELLAPHGDVTIKAMFGGRGVFVDGVMTALVDREGTPHVRGDDEVAATLETAGGVRHGMPYWSVPSSVEGDDEQLALWIERAVATARAHA